jgi:hypothetical protein
MHVFLAPTKNIPSYGVAMRIMVRVLPLSQIIKGPQLSYVDANKLTFLVVALKIQALH